MDTSKFDSLKAFINCLLVLFWGKPMQLEDFINAHLLPFFERIRHARLAILSIPLDDSIPFEMYRQQVYHPNRMVGKLTLPFLLSTIISEKGLDTGTRLFKDKKGMKFDHENIMLDAIVISKLAQNEKISRKNLYEFSLDFEEFAMVICQIVYYAKENELGPKAF